MRITRSKLYIAVDGRPVTVEGEQLLPRPGQPDFVVFSGMLERWEDGGPISAEDKQRILDQILREAADQNIRVEID